MLKKTLTFINYDGSGRPVYKDENKKLWKDVDNRQDWLGFKNENFHNAYKNQFEGEPDMPMKNDIEITFIPERIIRGYEPPTFQNKERKEDQ